MSSYPEYLVVPNLAKSVIKTITLSVLIIVTGIFIFFPACIFSGATICWDYDVTDYDHRIVLLISSAIILFLCTWAWIKVLRDPKNQSSSHKSVSVLVITSLVISGLVVMILGTSSYWGVYFGH